MWAKEIISQRIKKTDNSHPIFCRYMQRGVVGRGDKGERGKAEREGIAVVTCTSETVFGNNLILMFVELYLVS